MKTLSNLKSVLLVAAVAGLLMFSTTTSANADCHGGGWNGGWGGGPQWHDTSHYDYHPGGYVPHGNHYDYVPGHYDFHQSGHYHW